MSTVVRTILCALLLHAGLLLPIPSPGDVASASTLTLEELLAVVPVAPEWSGRYSRSSFDHWVDADRDCQDTRVEVLAEENLAGTTRACKMPTGRWFSWLDGATLTVSRSLDVDHLVALAEAWRSGAHAWSSSQRTAYANDLGYRWSLSAVSASSNRSKSDRDPAGWLPAAPARCEYVARWLAVKYRWSLSVDPTERSAIRTVTASCPAALVELPGRVDGLPQPAGSPSSPGTTQPSPGQPSPGQSSPVQPWPAVTSPPQDEPSPSVTTSPRLVTPGAFCSPAGASGTSSKGVVYTCRPSDTDVRNRWRR